MAFVRLGVGKEVACARYRAADQTDVESLVAVVGMMMKKRAVTASGCLQFDLDSSVVEACEHVLEGFVTIGAVSELVIG